MKAKVTIIVYYNNLRASQHDIRRLLTILTEKIVTKELLANKDNAELIDRWHFDIEV